MLKLLTDFGTTYSQIFPKVYHEFNNNIMLLSRYNALDYTLYSNVRDKLVYQYTKYSDLMVQKLPPTEEKTQTLRLNVTQLHNLLAESVTTEIGSMNQSTLKEYLNFIQSDKCYLHQLRSKISMEKNQFKRKNAEMVRNVYNAAISNGLMDVLHKFPEMSIELVAFINTLRAPVPILSFGESEDSINSVIELFLTPVSTNTFSFYRAQYPNSQIILIDKCLGNPQQFIQYNMQNIPSLTYLNLYYNVNRYMQNSDQIYIFNEQLRTMQKQIEMTRNAGITNNDQILLVSDISKHERSYFYEPNPKTTMILKKENAVSTIVLFYSSDEKCELTRDTETNVIEFKTLDEMTNKEYFKFFL